MKLSETGLVCRQASRDDADAIARVFSPSLRLLSFLPILHTVAEDRWFIEHVIFDECDVTVAESGDRIVSFLARQDQEIRLLYTRTDFLGMGAGTQLIERAKTCDVSALELWCFQANVRGRRFYEARGFRAVDFTDGARNAEKTPDLRYRWDRTMP
jgi:GNAT superfamily N-acetyltransferase